MSQSNRIFNDAENAEIAAAYTDGATITQLASAWCCSPPTISEALRRTNTPPRPRSQPMFMPEQVAEIIAEYEAGTSLSQLAALYRCSLECVRDTLERAGVARRPRGGANFKGRTQE